jgi:P-type E1-E2 ATPase
VFAEVEPNQKDRIVLALKRSGNVVGYIGDGINDAPALHSADVSISVDSAVDVAKDTADIVLLEKKAPTSAICSVWRVHPSSCRFFRSSRSRSS